MIINRAQIRLVKRFNGSSFEKAGLSGSDFSFALLLDCDGKDAVLANVNFLDFREIPEEWKSKIKTYA